MTPHQIIAYVAGLKLTRYGVFGVGCALLGSWLTKTHPEESDAFWAQPIMSIIMALVGLWMSAEKTKKNKARAIEVAETALHMPPPVSEKDEDAAMAVLRRIIK